MYILQFVITKVKRSIWLVFRKLRSPLRKNHREITELCSPRERLAAGKSVSTVAMKEVLKRVDPNWFRIWLACYGGSLSVLAVYLLSAVASVGWERTK